MPNIKSAARFSIACAVWIGLRGSSASVPSRLKQPSRAQNSSFTVLPPKMKSPQLGVDIEEYHTWLIDVRGLNLGSLESAAPEDENNNSRDLLKYISGDEENWPSRLLER